MAGGGIKPGMSYGETDAMGYEIVKDPVEIRDLHADHALCDGLRSSQAKLLLSGVGAKTHERKTSAVVAEVLA